MGINMNKLILVVEDNQDIRHILTAILVRANYIVNNADLATQALTMIQTTSFDLILLDLMMPGMDGNGFLRMMASYKPEVPIIVVTASPQYLTNPDSPQIKGIITKPFQTKELLRVVEGCLALDTEMV
jgi:CheY-like chemotaxis protein